MCGITAYAGKKPALPFIIQGLSKLEYRGYDSAGVTLVNSDGLFTKKAKGRLTNLIGILDEPSHLEKVGIGHTRWATHGIPSNLNAHPHTNEANTISLVHNGIIENYAELKTDLVKKGYKFQSDTDSEVVVQLLDYYYQGSMKEALIKVVKMLQGSFSLCIVSTFEPDKIWVTKKDTPIVAGHNIDGSFVASDIPAILDYTKDVYFLDDYDICLLDADRITFFDRYGQEVGKELTHIPYDNESAKKGGFSTYMLKEINEQPYVIQETLRGRIDNNQVKLSELDVLKAKIATTNKVYFVACGTAYHACLSGASILKQLTGLMTISQPASEFRYNDPIIDKNTLCIFVTQSGETADTLAALRLAKERGATVLSVVNVLGSSISRESDATIYTYAGLEIAVASTKAYTTQVVLLALLAMYISDTLGNNPHDYHDILAEIQNLPVYVDQILNDDKIFKRFGKTISRVHDAYFIGRGLDYAAVQEGALKLKEVSYVHADAYYAGELKHGPIALIEEGTIVIAVATQPHVAAKTISNIQETIARGSHVILFTTKGTDINNIKDTYYLPKVHPVLQAILVAIPLQLIAYYTATYKGCDVDKPRNLAKSVTVE